MLNRTAGVIALLAFFASSAIASVSADFSATDESRIRWLEFDQPGANARTALTIIGEAPSHGLHLADYSFDELTTLQQKIVAGELDFRVEYEGLMTDALLRLFRDLRPQLAKDARGQADSIDLLEFILVEAINSDSLQDYYHSLIPRHSQYEALREALKREEHAAAESQHSQIGRGPTLRVGDTGERVLALRARLLDSPDHLHALDAEFDSPLEAAVQAYQRLHGLDADGLIGKRTQEHLDLSAAQRAARIRVALARWRELPVTLGDEYVHVNIPEYRLEMVRDGRREVEMRVVVGSRNDPTPSFNDEIEYLVFNPYWYVPRRIALEELVPKAAENQGYLTRQNYEVLSQWNPVDESLIDWAAIDSGNFDYRIRQQPGPGNALGAVKFLFPNSMNIYMHDSPARSLYDRPVRAFSHGCIRLENPAALAEALLSRQGEWDADRVEHLMSPGSRRQINLKQSVPVYLTYITAKVTDSGELALFDDIYGRDRTLLARHL